MKTAAELAMTLRLILEELVADMDRDILAGVAPVDRYNPDMIEGMATMVTTAEALSGVIPVPPEVLEEWERMKRDGEV